MGGGSVGAGGASGIDPGGPRSGGSGAPGIIGPDRIGGIGRDLPSGDLNLFLSLTYLRYVIETVYFRSSLGP